MEHNSMSPEAYKNLLKAIFPIVLSNGMKGTTMDKVASTLSISKRTLYEIFDSKEEMLKAAIGYSHRHHICTLTRIFKESETVIEAFYNILDALLHVMGQASPDFFRDMDSAYSKLRPAYDDQSDIWQKNLLKVIEEGLRQDVFRSDVNYTILLRMLRIQMESLKRMEEFLPPDVTFSEAFHTVCISFLRSIASQKGMVILEEVRKKHLDKETKEEIK